MMRMDLTLYGPAMQTVARGKFSCQVSQALIYSNSLDPSVYSVEPVQSFWIFAEPVGSEFYHNL